MGLQATAATYQPRYARWYAHGTAAMDISCFLTELKARPTGGHLDLELEVRPGRSQASVQKQLLLLMKWM